MKPTPPNINYSQQGLRHNRLNKKQFDNNTYNLIKNNNEEINKYLDDNITNEELNNVDDVRNKRSKTPQLDNPNKINETNRCYSS